MSEGNVMIELSIFVGIVAGLTAWAICVR